MKKYIALLLLIFITGCSITKIKEESFDDIIQTILYKDSHLSNVNFDGYKFYLPRGSQVKEKKEYNLEIRNNFNTYYLYVDTIAYYYKTKVNHEVDNKIFFSKNLNYNKHEGYIDITEVNNKYFLEVMYNYAKVESYVSKDNLYNAFSDICYILSTIDFNDSAIQYKLKKRELITTTEEFNIFKSKKEDDNFLKYVEEYDKYDKQSTNKDQDVIDTDGD